MGADRQREESSARRAEAESEVRGKQRSTWLIALGLLLFFAGGTAAANNPDSSVGGLLFGILGVGLLVAGIVIRPRT